MARVLRLPGCASMACSDLGTDNTEAPSSAGSIKQKGRVRQRGVGVANGGEEEGMPYTLAKIPKNTGNWAESQKTCH